MDRITKNQRIKSLENTVDSLTKAVNKLTTWSVYVDNMLTELNHALPDPEYDAKCEAQEADIDASLDRHAVRLGLSRPQPPLRGSELCRAMLERGDKWVVCMVANNPHNIMLATRPVLVFEYADSVFKTETSQYEYAVPVDMNGNEITELPDADPRPGNVLLRQDPHKYFDEGARYIVTDDLRVRDVQGDKWPFLRKSKDLYVFGLDEGATACFVKAEDAAHG